MVPPGKRRKQSSGYACVRCKSRKKGCDGDFTHGLSCSGCLKANVSCQYKPELNPSYVKMLESKIGILEGKLQQLEKCDSISSSPRNSVASELLINTNLSASSVGKTVVNCATSILTKNDEHTSVYVGASGMGITQMIESYLLEDMSVDLEVDSFEDFGPNFQANLSPLQNLHLVSSIIHDDELTKYYVDTYLNGTHLRFPFLKKEYIMSLHQNRHQLLPQNDPAFFMDRFTLIMVYSIGAFLKHQGQNFNNTNANHWYLYKYAISTNFSSLFQLDIMSNIHAILLLVLYKLRRPNGLSIWYLIGTALRLCVDFGLHRKNLDLFVKDPNEYLTRCKTFWSAYSLERVICHFFGRPISISDRDIDVHLPIDIDEAVTGAYEIKTVFYRTFPQDNYENFPICNKKQDIKRTSMSLSILYFKLRQIDSIVQRKIYRVDKKFNQIPRDIIKKLQKKMKSWINSLPDFLTTFEYHYCLFLFNKQIRSLIVPFIDKLEADDPLLHECMRSSVNICKMNRRIHDNDSSKNRISIFTLQTIFLSGMTIIYGLFSDKIKWDFEVGEGLRSCSSSLMLLSERTPSCSKYSRIFEKILDRVSQEKRIVAKGSSITRETKDDIDLFGQLGLMNQVTRKHYMENIKTFHKMTEHESDKNEKEFDNLLNFSRNDIFNLLQTVNLESFDTKFQTR